MTDPTPRELRGRLRRLGEDELARFVAALWAATGWSTSVQDGRVVARRHEPASERVDVAVVPGPVGVARTLARTPDDADLLVTPVGERAATLLAARADAEVLNAADLHERLTYAVDAEAREHLLAEHLGASPSRPRRRTVLSAVAVGAGVLGGGALARIRGSRSASGPQAASSVWYDLGGPTPGAPGLGGVDDEHAPPEPPGEGEETATTTPPPTAAPTPTTSVGCGVGARVAVVEHLAALRRMLSAQSGTMPEVDRPIGDDFDPPGEAFVAAMKAAGLEPLRDAASVEVGAADVQGSIAAVPITVRTGDGRTVRYEVSVVQNDAECWRTADVERVPVEEG